MASRQRTGATSYSGDLMRTPGTTALVGITVLLSCVAGASALSQGPAHSPPLSTPRSSGCPRVRDAHLPNVAIRQLPGRRPPALPADSLELLRTYLQSRCWPQALQTYLREFQSDLPAWIIYVDSRGGVTQGFTAGRDTSHVLVGQRYIWAMVFMDRAIRADSLTTVAHVLARDAAVSKAEAAAVGTGQGGSALVAADRVRAVAARAQADTAAHRAQAVAAQHSTALIGRARAERDSLARLADAAQEKLAEDSAGVAAARAAWDADAAATDAVAAASQAAADTADLRFARRTLVYKTDPTLAMLFTSLLKLFGSVTPPDIQLADSLRSLTLQQISADPHDSLWAGYSRFALVENTAVEVSLSPVVGKAFPTVASDSTTALQHVYGNFINAKQHTFELGILAGMTYGPPIPSFDSALKITSESARSAFNAYLIAAVNAPHWFQIGPPEHLWRASLGVFVGTNVFTGGLGDQIVTGVSVGHLLGGFAGLDVGAAWVPVAQASAGRSVTHRRPRLLFGTDLRF